MLLVGVVAAAVAVVLCSLCLCGDTFARLCCLDWLTAVGMYWSASVAAACLWLPAAGMYWSASVAAAGVGYASAVHAYPSVCCICSVPECTGLRLLLLLYLLLLAAIGYVAAFAVGCVAAVSVAVECAAVGYVVAVEYAAVGYVAAVECATVEYAAVAVGYVVAVEYAAAVG